MTFSKLTSSILSNLGGFAFPLLVGFVCIPIVINTIGVTRFGFLTVSWVLIGYFSVFDLGLGRALTQAISFNLGSGKGEEIYSLTRQVLLAMLGLSVVGGITLAFCVSVLIAYVLKMPDIYVNESRIALYVIAMGIPAVVLYSGFKGIIEAFGYFNYSAASRAVIGTWTFISPIIVFSWSSNLVWIITSLVVGRYVVMIQLGFVCLRIYAKEGYLTSKKKAELRGVLAFGGWMTVSNLISPLMVYMDRFFVSAIAGVSLVAYYTTPYDLISRLAFIPEAIFSVLFPVMTRHHASGSDMVLIIYYLSIKMLAFTMSFLVVCIICISPEFLDIWLNQEFSLKSYLIMDILAIGLYINVIARPSYNLIQARGRPDLTAKLHLLELPIYVPALVFGVHEFGVLGAAYAWLGRAFLDFVLLTLVALGSNRVSALKVILSIALLGGALIALSLIDTFSTRIGAGAFLLFSIVVAYKFVVMSEDDLKVVRKAVVMGGASNPI